jgi:hypothetical protein
MYRKQSACSTSQNTGCSWPLPATSPRAAEGPPPTYLPDRPEEALTRPLADGNGWRRP